MTATPGASMSERRLLVLVVSIIWAAGTLPFVQKSFTIDDPGYLLLADQIRRDPLRPFSGVDLHGRPAFTISLAPPLFPALLAAAIELDGGREREVPLHLVESLFAVLAAVSLWRLARRFGAPGPLTTLLLLLGPAVLASTSVMLDVPLLGLWLASVALHIDGVDRGSHRHLAAAGFLAGAAFLVKYNGAVILPVLAAYSVLRGRPRTLLWLALPVAMIGAFAAHNVAIYGRPHFLANMNSTGRVQELTLRVFLKQPSTTLCIFGSAAAWAPLALSGTRRAWVIAAVAAVVGALMCLRGTKDRVEMAVFFANAAAALIAIAIHVRDRVREDRDAARDDAFLGVWLLGVLAFNWLFTPFQAVRYYLPGLIPFALLLLRRRTFEKGAQALAVGLTIAVGFVVAAADQDFADAYRRFASAAAESRPAAGPRVWFSGDWGWMYYANRAGLRMLPPTPEALAPGDIVYVPLGVPQDQLTPNMRARLELLRTVAIPRTIPVRTQADGSGFHGVGPHEPPFAVALRKPIDLVEVYVVR